MKRLDKGNVLKRPFSVAPMMDWTDRHFRYFMRFITRHALLYTEMIPMGAIVRGDWRRFLEYTPCEKPLVLQVGGDDPESLGLCAKIAEDCGYDEINLNAGCPSSKVKSGRFGACMMADPSHTARCIEAMKKSCSIPVGIKHRIGVDDKDSFEELLFFVGTVAETGCDRFVIHARKAILTGLSTKENRTVPPLRYEYVHEIKKKFPGLVIEINGGIRTNEAAQEQLVLCDGVMVGRAAYENPYSFIEVDRVFFGDKSPSLTREEIAQRMIPYIAEWQARGRSITSLARHILGLYHGMPGASHFRRTLSGKLIGRNIAELMEDALSETSRVSMAAGDSVKI